MKVNAAGQRTTPWIMRLPRQSPPGRVVACRRQRLRRHREPRRRASASAPLLSRLTWLSRDRLPVVMACFGRHPSQCSAARIPAGPGPGKPAPAKPTSEEKPVAQARSTQARGRCVRERCAASAAPARGNVLGGSRVDSDNGLVHRLGARTRGGGSAWRTLHMHHSMYTSIHSCMYN